MNKVIKIRAHASSANLGVMFDCGGLAIKEFYTDISFSIANKIEVEVNGYGKEHIPLNEDNLARKAIEKYLEYTDNKLRGYKLVINNHIPFCGGLGSSAASILGSLKAVNHFFENKLNNEELLEVALLIEAHGDNLLACLLGGFTIYSKDVKIKNEVDTNLVGIITIPNYKVNTNDARKVLPKIYSKEDTIKALQNSSLLTHSIINKDYGVLSKVLENDTIHEPYRKELNAELESIRSFAKKHMAIGTTISGSGSAILTFVEKNKQQELYESLKKKYIKNEVKKISFINEGVIII